MNREACIADAWQVVGRKVSKERLLSDIYSTAVDSIGLPVDPNSDAVRMFRGQSRISKYGNARLRRTLWMVGQTAVLERTNSFRDKVERYISKERHNAHLRRKAYTAIAAKMARTVHAVVNHGDPYRPFFEGVSPGGRTSL